MNHLIKQRFVHEGKAKSDSLFREVIRTRECHWRHLYFRASANFHDHSPNSLNHYLEYMSKRY